MFLIGVKGSYTSCPVAHGTRYRGRPTHHSFLRMCEGDILHLMNCYSPALEVRLPPKAGNPLGNILQEGEHIDNILSGYEALRDAFS